MPRARLTFRQRDLAAALKAVKAARYPVARIEVGKDGIVIIPGEPPTENETLPPFEDSDANFENADPKKL